jgi:predicted nucleic acid-binding protein
MEFLIDSNVLSETLKPEPDPIVIDWLRMHESKLAVDPMVIGEIRFGILRLAQGKKRRSMELWFDAVVARIQCVGWGAEFGHRWAELVVTLRAKGKAMPLQDSFIATTALFHNLTVVTRNPADFANCGVRVVNPFAR